MPLPLGKELNDEIVRRLRAGQTARGIARALDVSRSVVGLRMRKLRLHRSQRYIVVRDVPSEAEAMFSLWAAVIELAVSDRRAASCSECRDAAAKFMESNDFNSIAMTIGCDPDAIRRGISNIENSRGLSA